MNGERSRLRGFNSSDKNFLKSAPGARLGASCSEFSRLSEFRGPGDHCVVHHSAGGEAYKHLVTSLSAADLHFIIIIYYY